MSRGGAPPAAPSRSLLHLPRLRGGIGCAAARPGVPSGEASWKIPVGREGRGGRGLAPRSRGSQAAALPRSHPRREPRCQRAQPTAGLITGRQSAGPEPSQIPRGAVAGDEVGGAVTGADATAERPWLGDRKSGRWGSLSAVIYGAARAHKRDAAALEMGRAGSELFPLPGVNNAARKPPRLSGV